MPSTSSVLSQFVAELLAGRLTVVDLTQPLEPKTPVIELPSIFAQSPGFSLETISRYDEAGPGWYWNTIHLGEHTGTHFDAPVHWVTGKDLPDNTCDTIPAARFIGPACVIDVSRESAADPDFLLSVEDLLAWEDRHGRVPAGAWVLLRTDWSTRADPAAFFNVDAEGSHTPGFHQSTSLFLAEQRDVLGVGVETVGTDAGQAGRFDPPFPNHATMHGHGKFGLASLANLDRLPPAGAVVIAAPLKIVDGSGSPVRVLAIVPA
ncbi:MAG TPA: cyclase family protein [Thermomicrobiaceae bacterium]|nr:cyclase family protein [Thermomicrobiaceae bacterium]